MRNYDSKSKFKLIFTFLIVIFIFEFLFLNFVYGAAPEELKNSINQKSQELQEINAKIKESQKNLEETQNQGKTLQKEIGKVDSQTRQLDLSIRSSEIVIDKLGLEINSLGYEIKDAEKEIGEREKTIIKIIQELQRKEKETPFVIFLKRQTLAEGFLEAQSLINLSDGFSKEINALESVKNDLKKKSEETAGKKQSIEVENGSLKNKKMILADVKKDKQTILKQTKNQEQIYQKSLSELEKKQSEIATEMEKLEEELRMKIDPSALPARRPGVLATPVFGYQMSQDYGATKFARSGGYRGKWHNGLDFAAPLGTPVFSAEKGKVVSVGNQDNYCYRGAYGKFIAIEHENNLVTLYAHLSLQTKKEGDIVNRGDLIGYVGRTGYATGPHLHFTVYAGQTFRIGPSRLCGPKMPFGGDLNPADYL